MILRTVEEVEKHAATLKEYGLRPKIVKFLVGQSVWVLLDTTNAEVTAILPRDVTLEQAALHGVTFGVNLPREGYDIMGVESYTAQGQVHLWGVIE